MTKAQKAEKATVEVERQRKIQQTADRNSERLRGMAERRSAAGAEGLEAEASRKSTRRKLHPLTFEEKAEKARHEVERRSVSGAQLSAPQAVRLSQRRKTNLKRLDILAIYTTNLYGENHHLPYFTQENSNNCVVCGATAGIF